MDFCDLVLKDANMEMLNKNTNYVIKPNKCNQCDYASAKEGNLKRHLKTHSGEKPNKCIQCDYGSSYANHLRRHLKTHSGKKST